jgi:hypothetical protein
MTKDDVWAVWDLIADGEMGAMEFLDWLTEHGVTVKDA